jgi:hypothetical protein
MDLRPVEVTVHPSASNSLLAEENSPVILRFNTRMVKNEAERILQISSESGLVNGDCSWNDNDLYFVPIAGWTAGIRYNLSLSGTRRALDGRELRIEHFVSFYAVNKNEPPFLEWYSPSDGESTGTGVCFELHFSRPMNRLSVESALTTEGIVNKTYEWSDNNKELKVSPGEKLSALTLYRWNLKDSAKSTDGVPLAKTYSLFFITDLDKNIPQVNDVYPVINTNGQWFPTGSKIETGLQQGNGIAVVFNKPMSENALRSLRFEPALSGRMEFLSEKSVVYIFTRAPDPEKIYTLIVSGDTTDLSGLKIGDDYKINFTLDMPYLSILSLSVEDISLDIDKNSSVSYLTVPINSAMGEIYIDIRFSLPLENNEEKQNIALKINLTAFFPKTISPVALKYAGWINDDILRMQWEGISAGIEEPHFYRLTIPGGKSGIAMSDGTYMKEDFIVYLEAVK